MLSWPEVQDANTKAIAYMEKLLKDYGVEESTFHFEKIIAILKGRG